MKRSELRQEFRKHSRSISQMVEEMGKKVIFLKIAIVTVEQKKLLWKYEKFSLLLPQCDVENAVISEIHKRKKELSIT